MRSTTRTWSLAWRRGDAGATLMEVMVVSTIFFLIMGAIVMIYLTSVRLERQVTLRSDVDRTLMAAVRHIDGYLKTARLVVPVRPDQWTQPVPVTTLELRPFRLQSDGTPVVTADGVPEWDPPFTITFEAATGDLVKVDSDRRVLARLGNEGRVSFLRPSKGMLEMNLKMIKHGAQEHQVTRDTTFQFRLFNQ
jgi:hypothetical protein